MRRHFPPSTGAEATQPSTGRVQGPTLKFLITREQEIKFFVPTPYWTVSAEFEIGGSSYLAEYRKRRIEKKTKAENIVKCCKGKKWKARAYIVWKDALGISWGEYLKELMKNAYTGSWAKKVAEQILNEKK